MPVYILMKEFLCPFMLHDEFHEAAAFKPGKDKYPFRKRKGAVAVEMPFLRIYQEPVSRGRDIALGMELPDYLYLRTVKTHSDVVQQFLIRTARNVRSLFR